MSNIDLHVHSTASDGSYTPSELVDYAIEKNLSAFALTDHDTCDGISEAINYSLKLKSESKKSVKVIPGIELSAEYSGEDVHILGLNIRYEDKAFLTELQPFVDARNARNHLMVSKMNEHGINITEEMVNKRFGDAVITRAHYAILMIEMGYVSSKEEAFEKYLNKGCPFYIPRHKITPSEAVRLIKSAGGHPVMAHPVLYSFEDDVLDNLVCRLADEGLEGIEAVYSCNKPEDTVKYTNLAAKYNLYLTGGSDFHGTAKPGLELGTGYGDLAVPESFLKNIL